MANEITSQREELFEDPEKYRPERWLNEKDQIHQDYSYLPFGRGMRSCLGKNLAETQMMLLTAKVDNFRIQQEHLSFSILFTFITLNHHFPSSWHT
jgi:cytochrome P450